MTIKKVEPLKFKGNKVYYLHKLSEKGADALKTKFPDGHGGEIETTIQAAIDELATNGGGGGGGSTPSAQPDRVIIIDTTLEEDIEGKAYSTFAAAKAYIESLNTTDKFCIELPAGNFPEPITLDEKWLIHGNNTKLTYPVYSNVVLGLDLTMNPSGVFISDCTVSGGFAGLHAERDDDAINLPVYKLNHCRITEFCSASETEDLFLCLCEYCEIETTRSHNDLIAKGTPMSVPHAVVTYNSTILQFGTSAVTRILCFNSGIRNVGAYQAKFVCCTLANKFEEEAPEINVVELLVHNSSFRILKSINANMGDLTIRNSDIDIVMNGTVSIFKFSAVNSYINLRSDETATITIGNSWVSPDTVCRTSNVTWFAATDHTMCYIMYSTDGGQTMSYNSTGATHYGILKNLSQLNAYDTSYYMWFPMPE